MIDSHCHILPGVDDGSKNMEETLEIIRQLSETGFKKLIATPHVIEGRELLTREEILATTERVKKRVVEAGIPVEVWPGAENYIFPEMAKWARDQKLMTLGNTGKYLLVEFPMLEIPHYTDQVFFELQVAGLTPVLAHPERNREIVDNPERLLDWAKKGILFQLDLRSVNGKYGSESKKLADLMLTSDLINFIGSDAHRVARSSGSYIEDLQKVLDILGKDRFNQVTLANPQAVLDGNALMSEEDRDFILNAPLKKKKRGFWNLFR